MKIFISWSGEPSRSIAAVLYDWIPSVMQHVEPWMSDEEIESGMRWNEEVAKALDETDFGIVCVTRSNQHKPWLIFESGALAKRLETARIIPLCIDLAPAEITGPLVTFQGRSLDREGMRKIVHELSRIREKPLAAEQVDMLYQAVWPRLEQEVTEAKRQNLDIKVNRRSNEDMLEEIVDRLRRIERQALREAGVVWKRSSFASGSGGAEVAMIGDDEILVRDAKSPDEGTVSFTVDEWVNFVAEVKKGNFDNL